MNWKDKGRRAARKLMRISALRAILRKLSLAGLVPPWVWKRLPVEGVFPVILPDGRSFLYSATASDGIARAFLKGPGGLGKRDNPYLLQIGAVSPGYPVYWGKHGLLHSAWMRCDPTARVISIEPVPRVCEKLLEHLRLNHFDDRCEVHQVAVSNFTGTAQMHIPLGDLPTSASLNPEGFRGFDGILMEVPVTTVDDIVGKRFVDLAKIDVEGFEPQVLEGMQCVLSASRPSLFIECLPDGPYRQVEEILKDFGYRIYALSQKGPVPVERVIPRRWFHENFLFLHPSRDIRI